MDDSKYKKETKYASTIANVPKHEDVDISAEMFGRMTLHEERSIDEQIAALPTAHKKALEELKEKWLAKERKVSFSDAMFLRFLRASPGDTKFNVRTAYKVMINYASWSLQIDLPNLTIAKVRRQLETKCLILSGAKSKQGHHLLYMKPGRYYPGRDNLDELLRSLVYLLERMTERESTATEGLAFMANMADWGWSNFSMNYAKNFFDTMQGRFPCRVRLFLIANPPSWFGMIWRLIRPMMSKQFADKVFLPVGDEIYKYLDQDNVPDEMGGSLDMNEALNSFIKYRYAVEGLEYTDTAIHISSPKIVADKV